MYRNTVSSVMLVLLVTSMSVFAFKIQPVRAMGTITINADGSITPSTAPIYTADNITYTLTGNIATDADADGIVIERDNIVLDGAGYTVTGGGTGIAGRGITATEHTGVTGVTVRNMAIRNFSIGIVLSYSSTTLSGNNVANNKEGIWIAFGSSTLSGNTVTANNGSGIGFYKSIGSTLSGNTVTANNGSGILLSEACSGFTLSGNTVTANNGYGIELGEVSNHNSISGNNIANNEEGIGLYISFDNSIFHNSFVDNTVQAYTDGSANTWDNGYPSGGNYWSDYTTRYPNATEMDNSGLWNTPYVIDANNKDNYPLMPRYGATINAHCNTEGIDVAVPITEDGSTTGYTTPHTFNGLSGSHTFTVQNTDGNGHPFLQWSTSQTSTTITVTSGGTYTAYYQAPTYNVTISAHCNTEGSNVSVAITEDGSSTGFNTPHTFAGLRDSHTFIVPSADASGHPFQQWSTGQTSTTITVTSGGTYMAYYQAGQRSLAVSSAHDSPSPSVGVHTYNDSSSVTCSVSSPVVEGGVSHTCTGWSGTGSVPSTGSGTSVTFTITQNSTITWNWAVTQWKLTVSSAHDSPNPSVGDHLYSDGSTVTCSVTSPVTEGSTVWTCTGYSGTGSVPSSASGTSVTFTITQDSTITWNWQTGALVHDVAVTNVTSSKTGVGQGYDVNMTVTVLNPGDFTETFIVTVYANGSTVGTQTVNNISNGTSIILNFIWNTTSFAYGNYNINACALPVSGETNTTNNNCTGGLIAVSIPGDLNGDYKVSLQDLVLLANAYGSKLGDSKWNPNADINGDGKVSLQDLVILASPRLPPLK